jgi:2,3-bisphosphoglycerate-independent phosphoglycerate mutase
LSPGGVHSHERHLFALAKELDKPPSLGVRVHAFLDGRDTPPRSAGPSIERLQSRRRRVSTMR